MIRLGTETIIPFIKNNLNDMPSSLMCYIYQFISLDMYHFVTQIKYIMSTVENTCMTTSLNYGGGGGGGGGRQRGRIRPIKYA